MHEMEGVLKVMKARDCHQNIAKMQEELRSILSQKNINTNARISHSHLASVRKLVPQEFLSQSSAGGSDYDRINITLLNEYLNRYAEKLSRAGSNNPSSIKIDFGQFDLILAGVENQTYNPFGQHLQFKAEKRKDSQSHEGRVRQAKPRLMGHLLDEEQQRRRDNPIMTQIMDKLDKQHLDQEIEGIMKKFEAGHGKTENNYMKKGNINNFDTYKNVINDLKLRSDKLASFAPE